jgi:polyisoprenoid-binding protein YceI
MSGSGRRAGFHFDARLIRTDWGLTWNMALEAGGWLVGGEVRLEIDVAADETGAVIAGA